MALFADLLGKSDYFALRVWRRTADFLADRELFPAFRLGKPARRWERQHRAPRHAEHAIRHRPDARARQRRSLQRDDNQSGVAIARHLDDLFRRLAVRDEPLDPREAAKTERNGRTYYFCSEQCKKQFESDPKKYGA